MEPEAVIENYKEEILELFKKNFKESFSKNVNVNFEYIILLTQDQLGISLSDFGEIQYLKNWYNNICLHQQISSLVEKNSFNEMIFHSHQWMQTIYLDQKNQNTLPFVSTEDFQLCLEILAQRNHIEWNYRVPFASFNLYIARKKLRVTLVHFSTTTNGISKLFLRHLCEEIAELSDLNLEARIFDILQTSVREKMNILVCGATGSGKTTLLKALLNSADSNEHIITLEDTHELSLNGKNQTSLLSQPLQGKSLKDYCSYALRMSPDRLVIGEMRSDEVVPFILAMNTGHRGLMSSIHANSCKDAIARVALLFCIYHQGQEISYETIVKLICHSINLIIFVENKKVQGICKVIGAEGDQPILERFF